MGDRYAYALDGSTPVRFDDEHDRDRWVEGREPTGCQPIDAAAHRVQRYEQLVDHGLARWQSKHNPDLGLTYEMPDLVIPAQVRELPPGQAQAYWLCDHDDGPGLTQKKAADLLDTSPGSIFNQLDRARDKMED